MKPTKLLKAGFKTAAAAGAGYGAFWLLKLSDGGIGNLPFPALLFVPIFGMGAAALLLASEATQDVAEAFRD